MMPTMAAVMPAMAPVVATMPRDFARLLILREGLFLGIHPFLGRG